VLDTELELLAMIRTVFMIGLFALLGFFLLGTVFSLFGTAMGLALWLVRLAIKVLIVGAIVYLVIRVVSPETARRLRARFSGPSF
jgi:hypothetical protein